MTRQQAEAILIELGLNARFITRKGKLLFALFAGDQKISEWQEVPTDA